MKKTYALRVEEEILAEAKKTCKKNMTSLSGQIREFIKRLAKENIILKEEL